MFVLCVYFKTIDFRVIKVDILKRQMLPVKCYPHRKLKAEVYYAYYISGSIEKSPLKEMFELNSSPYYLPLLKNLL